MISSNVFYLATYKKVKWLYEREKDNFNYFRFQIFKMDLDLRSFFFHDLQDLITATDLSRVYREDIGNLSYKKKFRPILDKLFHWLKTVDINIEEVPQPLLQDINIYYTSFFNYLFEISRLSNSDYTLKATSNFNQLQDYYNNAFNWWSKVFALFNQGIDLNQLTESQRELIQKNFSILNDSEEKVNTAVKEAQLIKDSLALELDNFNKNYKDIFARAEFLKQEEIFTKAALDNKQTAKLMEKIIVITTGIVLILFIVFLSNLALDEKSLPSITNYISQCQDCSKFIIYFSIIKASTLKILLLSIFIYILKVVISIYRANLHNYTINTQKANSFSAALVLFDKIQNETTKEKILVTGADAIFKHLHTGFYDDKDSLKETEYVSLVDKLLNVIESKTSK